MIELRVDGMTCGHCVSAVTRAVKSVDPEADVRVDLEGKRVRVEGRSSADALGRVLAEAGYPASPAGEQAPAVRRSVNCCDG
jgi:copper chaperone CopZ